MIFIVFSSVEEYTSFRTEFPTALASPDTILGEPFVIDDGRAVIAHTFNEEECALLQMAGADVRVGGIDGPEFGVENAS